jgi:predicted O-methyltransferase YrrM
MQGEQIVRSGIEAADIYIEDGYQKIKGMSSVFAASVCCGLMRIQSSFGVAGHAVEIGTFEGRFFIALAHCLNAGELALGIDSFDWPDPQIGIRFSENCRKYGVDNKAISWAVNSQNVRPAELKNRLSHGRIRLIHVDGDHSRAAFESDLQLASAVVDPAGLIVLDDMLHPGYPTLMASLFDFLAKSQHLAVLCIIDRESIFAATKFVLCHKDWFSRYEAELLQAFRNSIWPLGANFDTYRCMVLSRDTRVAAI